MDGKFWIGIGVNVIGLYLTYRQMRLQERAVGGADRPSKLVRVTSRYWPLLAMAALIAVAWMPYVIETIRPAKTAPTVTTENIEPLIKSWLDRFGISTKSMPELPDAIFGIQGTASDGRRVVIARVKKFDQYVLIQASVGLSEEHKKAFASLAPRESARLVREILVQLSGSGIDFSLDTSPLVATIARRVPITTGLTEHQFISDLDRVFIAQTHARAAIGLAIEQATTPAPAKSR